MPVQTEVRKGMSTGAKVAIGCGVAVGLAVLLLVAGVVVIAVKGKDIAGYAIAKGADAAINSSSLSDAEKEDAKSTVRRFIPKAMAGEIPEEEARAVMEEFAKGTFGTLAVVGDAQQAVQESGLDDEEKRKADETMQKLFAGILQKKISDQEAASVMDAAPQEADGRPKELPWTDEELRTVVAQADAVIAGKDIEAPEGPPDLAEPLRDAVRAMKQLMGEPVEPAVPTEAADEPLEAAVPTEAADQSLQPAVPTEPPEVPAEAE